MAYARWMSDFHGGFFVRSVDALVVEQIRVALATALRERRIEPESNSFTLAVKHGCPVIHIAVRGPVADGKDDAFFHYKQSDLGAEVAHAAGVEVWAYHYENQSGSDCRCGPTLRRGIEQARAVHGAAFERATERRRRAAPRAAPRAGIRKGIACRAVDERQGAAEGPVPATCAGGNPTVRCRYGPQSVVVNAEGLRSRPQSHAHATKPEA